MKLEKTTFQVQKWDLNRQNKIILKKNNYIWKTNSISTSGMVQFFMPNKHMYMWFITLGQHQ